MTQMTTITNPSQSVTLSMDGGLTFTGKDVVVKSMTVEKNIHQNEMCLLGSDSPHVMCTGASTVSISLDLECLDSSFEQLFEPKNKTKIRYKYVKDCDIQELLYAVRQKTKEVK